LINFSERGSSYSGFAIWNFPIKGFAILIKRILIPRSERIENPLIQLRDYKSRRASAEAEL
jgi:hypothetical protein